IPRSSEMPGPHGAVARSGTPAMASWRVSCRLWRRLAALLRSSVRWLNTSKRTELSRSRFGSVPRRESPSESSGSLWIDGSACRAALFPCSAGIQRGCRAVHWKGLDLPGPRRSFTQRLRSADQSARYQTARRTLIPRERQCRTLATRRACVGKKELTSAINTLDHCLMQPRLGECDAIRTGYWLDSIGGRGAPDFSSRELHPAHGRGAFRWRYAVASNRLRRSAGGTHGERSPARIPAGLDGARRLRLLVRQRCHWPVARKAADLD